MLNPNLISRLPKPLSCRLLAPLLTRYVEAEQSLSPPERKAIADHLHACPVCAEEIEAIQAMSGFLHERAPALLPAPMPSPDLWDRIEAQIIAEEAPAKPARSGRLPRPVLIAAPAFAALVVAAIVLPKAMQTPSSAPEMNEKRAVAPAVSGTLAMEEEQETSRSALRSAPPSAYKSAIAAAPMEATMPSALRSESAPVVSRARALKQTQVALRMRPRSSSAAPRRAATDRLQPTREYVMIDAVSAPKVSPRPRTMVAMGDSSKTHNTMAAASADTFAAPSTGNLDMMMRNAHVRTMPPAPIADGPTATYNSYAVPAARSHAGDALFDTMPPAATGTITIVKSDPGTGVPASKDSKTPVTETLIRSRQRRGLFGGYGAGVTAMMPGSIETKKSEAGVPW